MKPVSAFALASGLALIWASGSDGAKKQGPELPVPKLSFVGTEAYEANGFDFVRYKYEVANRARFKKELFAASPDLPPCGENPSASRTWIDLFDADGKKLYWFCALSGPEDLANLWFALTDGVSPPASIYIEMTDRRTGARIRSNLASTGTSRKAR